MSSNLVSIDDLVTLDDIAKRMHWSLNTTMNIAQGRDGRYKLKFPKPLIGPAKRGVWLWTDVWNWFEETAPKVIENRKRSAQVAETTHKRDWRHGSHTA